MSMLYCIMIVRIAYFENVSTRRGCFTAMTVLVLGGEGMLGHKMTQVLRNRFPEVICTLYGSLSDDFYRKIDLFKEGPVIERVNATDFSTLTNILEKIQPDAVVNCIGIIKQRDETRNAIISITLNSLLPHKLAEICAPWGGRVIHFSTDCVFNGHKGNYTEDDPSDAEDFYGKSKFLGEVSAPNAVTLRTSIIGRELCHYKSLLEWFLSQNGGQTNGFRRVMYSGVTTNFLAGVVADILDKHNSLSGLYQVTSQTISKHDLLCQVRDAFSLDVEIVPDDTEVSDRSMLCKKLDSAIGYVAPRWPDLVRELKDDPTPYQKWRE